jgi:hypothetical protein
LPNIHRKLYGQPFTTNEHGMRDRPYAVQKPEGVFRIALVGSSMDMGWGVSTDDTYVNRLEDWLNVRAAKRGLSRRFEVLNFAVAAYSPMQRLEAYRRKGAAFHPDLVIYSATLLDARLMEIHICDMLQSHTDLRYDFLRRAVADTGITPHDLQVDEHGKFVDKAAIKAKLQPFYWVIYEATLGTLAADCRSAGVPLIVIVVPRVGRADASVVRAAPVARLRAIAARHGITLFDLSDTFDRIDPARIEIAPWDDHPNALGHERLFVALARALVQDKKFYGMLFP